MTVGGGFSAGGRSGSGRSPESWVAACAAGGMSLLGRTFGPEERAESAPDTGDDGAGDSVASGVVAAGLGIVRSG
ncbi:hypothetical protein NMK54_08940 [Nocardia otitidiscaviarum]|uniref:hypothetical protein n=1 Tax=Nocardia otitidiscaviarum TaxID=1823 RepID=UPI0020CD8066|nr:hypothetical protein [Nocardia otitidiscaviarum]MCP9620281.1 hypothetical protein [Nocardia otitidiscaviarum]